MAEEKIDWKPVVAHAAQLVESYETQVTLRQLFYRLVAAQYIPNTKNAYKWLSHKTAIARRAGKFPSLIDNTRMIRRPWYATSAEAAARSTIRDFRLERTRDQEYSIYIGVEKNALATLLAHWFAEKGIPVVALGGYPSQTFVDEIQEDISRQDRPAVLIYGGDFDPTGMDILREFEDRMDGYFKHVNRVALNEDQIDEYDLPTNEGKHWDSRAAKFRAQYGKLIQVELDALPPEVLRELYEKGVEPFWDDDAFSKVMKEEVKEKKKLLLPSEANRLIEELRFMRDINHPDEIITTGDLDQLIKKYDKVFPR